MLPQACSFQQSFEAPCCPQRSHKDAPAIGMLWKPELWLAADALLRRPLKIYIAAPELWTALCKEDWGYAYHLERWFHKLLLEHASSVTTQSPEASGETFVPLP